MNRYVDERIAFSYPEDLRCTHDPGSETYYLRRGSFHVFLMLPDRGFWESQFHQAGHVRPILDQEQWTEDYAGHGFQGRARSMLARGRSGDVYGKRVDLVLRRGERRIWLRIDHDGDFPLDRVDPILETMAFPGEERYAECQRLGPIEERIPSPYVISLGYFPSLGRGGREGRAEFDVQYEDGAITDQQLHAVERFIADERQLYEQARLAVFRYFTEYIYPMSSRLGRYDDLWPSCRTVDEVMPLIELASLMVHEPRDDGEVPIGLRFHCSWDVEHGLGLRAVGPSIEAVGADFVALSPRGGGEWPGFRRA